MTYHISSATVEAVTCNDKTTQMVKEMLRLITLKMQERDPLMSYEEEGPDIKFSVKVKWVHEDVL